jgi:predicted HicB family RNase H-like nuclease
MPPQKAEEETPTHPITIRFPEDVYENLRRQAFDGRISMNTLVVEAVRAKQTPHAVP